jgi:hypothetical protein
MKPKLIVDYSCKLGTVDGSDMVLSYVQFIRKSVKRYKKMAPDIALPNGHALYLMNNEKGISLPDFQMSVIGELLEKPHLGVDGVQVGTFPNIWQTVTC